jgi:AcrR family transcriptional regulator
LAGIITSVTSTPTRGRQAEAARNDRKVLDAARVVFTARGWDAPVSAIAAEAGVGMGSLYRRYGSKTELFQRLCVLAMQQNIDAARAALHAEDPLEGLVDYIRACVDFGAGAFAPLAGIIDVTDEMLATARRSHRLLTRVVTGARAQGLRSDVTPADIEALIALFGRSSAAIPPRDATARERLLVLMLDGLRTVVPTRLPGRRPSLHQRAARWVSPSDEERMRSAMISES